MTSLALSPKHPETMTMVLYGSFNSPNKALNSLGVRTRGGFNRLLLWRTNSMGLWPIIFHRRAH